MAKIKTPGQLKNNKHHQKLEIITGKQDEAQAQKNPSTERMDLIEGWFGKEPTVAAFTFCCSLSGGLR